MPLHLSEDFEGEGVVLGRDESPDLPHDQTAGRCAPFGAHCVACLGLERERFYVDAVGDDLEAGRLAEHPASRLCRDGNSCDLVPRQCCTVPPVEHPGEA